MLSVGFNYDWPSGHWFSRTRKNRALSSGCSLGMYSTVSPVPL